MADSYTVTLTADEALVLDALLDQVGGPGAIQLKDMADVGALWALNAAIEKQLPNLFAADYQERLEDARTRLREKVGKAPG